MIIFLQVGCPMEKGPIVYKLIIDMDISLLVWSILSWRTFRLFSARGWDKLLLITLDVTFYQVTSCPWWIFRINKSFTLTLSMKKMILFRSCTLMGLQIRKEMTLSSSSSKGEVVGGIDLIQEISMFLFWFMGLCWSQICC